MIEFVGVISDEDLAIVDKETIGIIKRHALVRCKDCKWHSGKYYCRNTDTWGFYDDDYCSYAERSEE